MNPAVELSRADNVATVIIAFSSACLSLLAVFWSVFWWIRAITRKEARKS